MPLITGFCINNSFSSNFLVFLRQVTGDQCSLLREGQGVGQEDGQHAERYALAHFNVETLFLMPCVYTAGPSMGSLLHLRKLPFNLQLKINHCITKHVLTEQEGFIGIHNK